MRENKQIDQSKPYCQSRTSTQIFPFMIQASYRDLTDPMYVLPRPGVTNDVPLKDDDRPNCCCRCSLLSIFDCVCTEPELSCPTLLLPEEENS